MNKPQAVRFSLRGCLRSAALVIAGGVVAGCGGGGTGGPGTPTNTNVEIFSWWVSGSETEALTALLKVYETSNPGAKVTNAAVMGTSNAKQELQTRMVQGLPPDTFQANGGDDLLHWVLYNGKDDTASKLEPIDSVGNTQEWWAVTPPALQNLVSYNGHIYGVPVDVSRTNCLFYNKKIFADNGLTPPTTLTDFFTVADALKAKGITPLAVGSQQAWTISTMVFESVLVASAGPQYYLDFFAGKQSAADQQLRDALTAAAKMFGYINTNHDSLLWNDAVGLVKNGTAAMNIMGDWAKGELVAEGAKPDVDFGEVNLGSDTFVFAMDAFPLPKGAPNRSGAISLLTTMGSLAGQNAFNPVKGSISPRTDVDKSPYDPLSQATIDAFKTATLVPANSAIVPSAFSDPVTMAMGTFINDQNVDNMILAIKNYYDTLTTVP
jgi:glucose/mannose transport system substrate-binding protein